MLLSPKRMATAWNWLLVLLGMGRILRVACALRGSLMRAEVGTNLSQSTFPGTEGQGISGWDHKSSWDHVGSGTQVMMLGVRNAAAASCLIPYVPGGLLADRHLLPALMTP